MAPETNREKTNTGEVSFVFEVLKTQKLGSVYWCCGQVPSANDVRQTIERTLKIPAPQNKSEPTIVSAIPRNTQIWGNILASYVDVLSGSPRIPVPRRGRNAWRTLRTSTWEASDIYALIKFKFDKANCIRLHSESLYPAKCFSNFIDMYVILYFFLPSYPSRTKSSITSLKKRTQRTLIKCLAINCTV